MNAPRLLTTGLVVAVTGWATGCAKDATPGSQNNCPPANLSQVTAPTGSAHVFSPDPMVDSGNPTLAASASNLDSYSVGVSLSHLAGTGVLQGSFVDVRDGGVCGGGYGAFSSTNAFVYSHSDTHFQEAMAYYWGDQYRAQLGALNYLEPTGAVRVLAHCPKPDNAFFFKGTDVKNNVVEYVCLGYSTTTQGAYYADDATVTVHELQHATTTDSYAPGPGGSLKQFFYDEAGALNEAVSDFMALTFEVPLLSAQFDPRLFSRWALGTFAPNHPGTRGAHRCPAWDPSYPNCGSYPAFSAANNTISYVYPDGVGWPYANNFDGPGYASNAFSTYKFQEEIHNAGVLLEGALWDVYDAIRANHGGDSAAAQKLSTQLVLEAIKHLPQPNLSTSPPALSPVTFRGLASQMSQYAAAVGLSAADQASVNAALTARGLLGGTQLTANWAAVGPGNAGVTPGIRVQDNPAVLSGWLISLIGDINAGSYVPQKNLDTSLNGKLDPGELVAIWFDVQDNEATTAGAVQLTVTALDPQITFDKNVNIGWISPTQSQIEYSKINGTAVVSALSAPNPTYNVGTGNSYFRTDPYFDSGGSGKDRGYVTALWVNVNPAAAHGATVRFQVQAQPSNGAASTATFTATIN